MWVRREKNQQNTDGLTIFSLSWCKASRHFQILLDIHSHGKYYFMCLQIADTKTLICSSPKDSIHVTP